MCKYITVCTLFRIITTVAPNLCSFLNAIKYHNFISTFWCKYHNFISTFWRDSRFTASHWFRVGTAWLESVATALFLPVSLNSQCCGSRCNVATRVHLVDESTSQIWVRTVWLESAAATLFLPVSFNSWCCGSRCNKVATRAHLVESTSRIWAGTVWLESALLLCHTRSTSQVEAVVGDELMNNTSVESNVLEQGRQP